jgi:HTH-type transcriptional regulator/antitoxin HigA
MSQRDLARRAGLSPKHVNRLLHGLVPLSPDVAVRLERVIGTPARIWNRLEANYRSDLERIQSKRDLAADVMWVRDFPVSELVKRDILPADPSDKVSRLEQLLAFFGVASVDTWDDVYAELACAFRTTKAFEAKPKALAAWLRLGEVAARTSTASRTTASGWRRLCLRSENSLSGTPTFSTTKCGTSVPLAASPWSSSQSCVAPGRAA